MKDWSSWEVSASPKQLQAVLTKSAPSDSDPFKVLDTSSSVVEDSATDASPALASPAVAFKPVSTSLGSAKGMAGNRVRSREGGMVGGTMEEDWSTNRGEKIMRALQNDSNPGRGRNDF